MCKLNLVFILQFMLSDIRPVVHFLLILISHKVLELGEQRSQLETQSNKMLAEQCPVRHFICDNPSFYLSFLLLSVPLSYLAPRKHF